MPMLVGRWMAEGRSSTLAALFLLLVRVTFSRHQESLTDCKRGMYVADTDSLCLFYQCAGADGTLPVLMQCAPGTRVNKALVTTDDPSPCSLHTAIGQCLRCDHENTQDPPLDTGPRPDFCAEKPCESGCECINQYSDRYCRCPGAVVKLAPPKTEPIKTFFCDSSPCQNGATCHSQYTTYWCQCPPGYVGRNCQTELCAINPCRNGGTCRFDFYGHYCECPPCYDGSCCEVYGGSGGGEEDCGGQRGCGPVDPCTNNPNSFCEPAGAGHTCVCLPCFKYRGNDCVRTTGLCSCNPCGESQLCEDDQDPFSSSPHCRAYPTAGSQFTLAFMQNVNQVESLHLPLEIYISSAGYYDSEAIIESPLGGCTLNLTSPILIPKGKVTRVPIPNECMLRFEDAMRSPGTKALTISERNDMNLMAYAINRDKYSADAFLALPDSGAGFNYRTVSWFPLAMNGIAGQFLIIALEDNTQVFVQTPPGVETTLPASYVKLTLHKHETYFVQATSKLYDITGSVISANRRVHVWSGNVRTAVPDLTNEADSRDHLVEQIPDVEKWGTKFVVYAIDGRPPKSSTRQSTPPAFTYIRLVRAFVSELPGISHKCEVYRSQNEPSETLTFDPDLYSDHHLVLDMTVASGSGPVYIECTVSVMCAQFERSQLSGLEKVHDPSFTYIPPLEQCASLFHFDTPMYTGGDSGITRPYSFTRFVVVSHTKHAQGILLNGAPVDGRPLGGQNSENVVGRWQKVPGTATDLWAVLVTVSPGSYRFSHAGDSEGEVIFQVIVYGSDDRESYGLPVSMLMNRLLPEGVEVTHSMLGLVGDPLVL